MNRNEAIANLAFFLLEKTGGVCGRWQGKMKAAEQRALFGMFLGKGTIVINGANETLLHIITVAFGMDYEVTYEKSWSTIGDTNNLAEWTA